MDTATVHYRGKYIFFSNLYVTNITLSDGDLEFLFLLHCWLVIGV